MIIIGKKYGQLGNRLFLYAHLIAAAEEYGVKLMNPAFAEYAERFPRTRSDLWCHYPELEASAGSPRVGSPSRWKRNLVSKTVELSGRGIHYLGGEIRGLKVIRLRTGEQCDLASDSFASQVLSQDVLLQGWLFRSEHLLNKHAEKVKSHLAIDFSLQEKIQSRLSKLREQADLIVGIHIRQGDYATYLGGKYYYPTSQYSQLMRQIADHYSPSRVAFLVCGNGEFSIEDFQGLNVSCEKRDVMDDLYSLAQVDLLVGPPSTFTGWASFYGSVPIYWLESQGDMINVGESLPDRSSQAA